MKEKSELRKLLKETAYLNIVIFSCVVSYCTGQKVASYLGDSVIKFLKKH